jgi:hypothetical protein
VRVVRLVDMQVSRQYFSTQFQSQPTHQQSAHRKYTAHPAAAVHSSGECRGYRWEYVAAHSSRRSVKKKAAQFQ